MVSLHIYLVRIVFFHFEKVIRTYAKCSNQRAKFSLSGKIYQNNFFWNFKTLLNKIMRERIHALCAFFLHALQMTNTIITPYKTTVYFEYATTLKRNCQIGKISFVNLLMAWLHEWHRLVIDIKIKSISRIQCSNHCIILQWPMSFVPNCKTFLLKAFHENPNNLSWLVTQNLITFCMSFKEGILLKVIHVFDWNKNQHSVSRSVQRKQW